jgi:hypothetical protein
MQVLDFIKFEDHGNESFAFDLAADKARELERKGFNCMIERNGSGWELWFDNLEVSDAA